MSSEEEEQTSPVLPKDSDQGSSVSSDLQVIIQKHIPIYVPLYTSYITQIRGHSNIV